MGHEDWTPRSPQGSQISTKITCIKKRITILSKFLHILKPVIQSHHTPMQEQCFINIMHLQCGGKPQSEVLLK